MIITLPPLKDTKEPQTIKIEPAKSVVVLGANGAGKTRFTRAIVKELGGKALHLNVLQALYNPLPDATAEPFSLLSHFSPAVLSLALKGDSHPTLLEVLLSQLMHEEMLNLIGYKLTLADKGRATLRRTGLDSVIELWRDVFPSNHILIDSGKLLFSRGLDAETYSSLRLSDGERAVLYYAGAILYAPQGACIFVESPELFLHPTLTTSLWNRIEAQRSDCTFFYTTHDPEFATSRNGSRYIWVRDFDTAAHSWDYSILPQQQGITNEIYMTLTGSRKPVLFIEGEPQSIDARLYPLIFPDYTVRSLGSCNKVIEATRTFNDINSFHHVDSMGIVDRDRRNDEEVSYLRRKRIMVPEVAEVENIFIIEDVIRAMARSRKLNEDRIVQKVKKAVINLFKAELQTQALMHTRHRMKRTVEYRIDGRLDSIGKLENHIAGLVDELAPRTVYNKFCNSFSRMVADGDYPGILKVFNMKSMLSNCNVAPLCGFSSKDAYIDGVIALLHDKTEEAETIRRVVRNCLRVSDAEDCDKK